MDPLTLLRELFGEEPIRKVVTSGFDSVHKIAAATPESLSFFCGINEILARQIVTSAEESLNGPPAAAYRAPLASVVEEGAVEEPVPPPVLPRVPHPSRTATSREGKHPAEILDENPLLDAGGILKTVALGPRPKELESAAELLESVGLSDAEANFLEGISPWPGDAAPRERSSSAPPDARPADILPIPDREEKEVEYAAVSDWSPEQDPDPVPRLVRAPELGPSPSPGAAEEAGPPADLLARSGDGTGSEEQAPAAAPAEGETALEPSWTYGLPEGPSFWRFGK